MTFLLNQVEGLVVGLVAGLPATPSSHLAGHLAGHLAMNGIPLIMANYPNINHRAS
jgi:hypothetical protein